MSAKEHETLSRNDSAQSRNHHGNNAPHLIAYLDLGLAQDVRDVFCPNLDESFQGHRFEPGSALSLERAGLPAVCAATVLLPGVKQYLAALPCKL